MAGYKYFKPCLPYRINEGGNHGCHPELFGGKAGIKIYQKVRKSLRCSSGNSGIYPSQSDNCINGCIDA